MGRINNSNGRYNKTSKFISLILRHNPGVIGIDVDSHGWADVNKLIAGIKKAGHKIDMDILEEANIRKADVVMVVTDNDNINILVSQIAKNIFEVEEVIIRLYDHEKECVCRDSNINTIFPALLSSSEVDKILMI